MNILIIILLVLVLFGGSGYGFHAFGPMYGGGISIVGIIVLLIALRLLGII